MAYRDQTAGGFAVVELAMAVRAGIFGHAC